MCFTKIFNNSEDAKEFINNPKQATEDIKVYKVVVPNGNGNYTGKYYSLHEYKIGESYKAINHYSIPAPIKGIFIHYIEKFSTRYGVNIDTGFHCKKTYESALYWAEKMIGSYMDEYYIIECIIPKGSFYYEDDKEETKVSIDSEDMVTSDIKFVKLAEKGEEVW